MKKTGVIAFVSFLSVGLMILSSCSVDSGTTSKFNVLLTDAPGDYKEINIDIKDVQIIFEDGEDVTGWTSLLNFKPGIYNLLNFVNGKDTLLASDDLTAGKVTQIRLVLGSASSLKLNDGTLISNLVVPSGQESGLKLLVNANIIDGLVCNVLLDFDAAKSIVDRGNGTYSLKPTIRTSLVAASGAVKGSILPLESHPNIQAIKGVDTITSYPDLNGKFLLNGLSAGTYKIHFSPSTGYQEQQKENVVVSVGVVTDLQTITLIKTP